MNGAADIKKAAITKAKQVAHAAHDVAHGAATNGSGNKKRRKGGDLKPIITTEEAKAQESSPTNSASNSNVPYVLPPN